MKPVIPRNGSRRLVSLLLAVITLVPLSLVQGQQSGYPLSQEPASIQLCMTCHGSYGQGSPVVGGPNLTAMEPWYLKRQLESFKAGYRGAEVDYIFAYEMRETVQGLSDTQIAELLSLVSSWPEKKTEETISGDVEHAQAVYQLCAACHGATAQGNELLGAPDLNIRNDWYLLKQLKLFKSGYRGSHPDDTYGNQMRVMVNGLAVEQDMLDLIAYINSLD